MLKRYTFVSFVLFQLFITQSKALQCWDCSSDIDRRCGDHFNATNVYGQRSSAYDRFGQNNYNNGQYNNQYNNQYNQQNYPSRQSSQYDPNYNQRNFQQFNQLSQNYPAIRACNEEDARLSNMKNVCIKKVTRRPNSDITIVTRRCQKVPFDTQVGTCYDPVSRGISLEFCEYCDYDGCNSANGIKFNSILISLIPLCILNFFRL